MKSGYLGCAVPFGLSMIISDLLTKASNALQKLLSNLCMKSPPNSYLSISMIIAQSCEFIYHRFCLYICLYHFILPQEIRAPFGRHKINNRCVFKCVNRQKSQYLQRFSSFNAFRQLKFKYYFLSGNRIILSDKKRLESTLRFQPFFYISKFA